MKTTYIGIPFTSMAKEEFYKRVSEYIFADIFPTQSVWLNFSFGNNIIDCVVVINQVAYLIDYHSVPDGCTSLSINNGEWKFDDGTRMCDGDTDDIFFRFLDKKREFREYFKKIGIEFKSIRIILFFSRKIEIDLICHPVLKDTKYDPRFRISTDEIPSCIVSDVYTSSNRNATKIVRGLREYEKQKFFLDKFRPKHPFWHNIGSILCNLHLR